MKACVFGVMVLLLELAACDRNDAHDGTTDGGSNDASASCPVESWDFGQTNHEPSWVTNSCPSGGCPSGTTCVYAEIDVELAPLGCAPVPAACDGTPSCACMGCVCGGTDTECAPSEQDKLTCETPTA
jgi:hypothetical protein